MNNSYFVLRLQERVEFVILFSRLSVKWQLFSLQYLLNSENACQKIIFNHEECFCKQDESVMRAFMEQTCGLSECALQYVLKFIMIISHELDNFIYLCCPCCTSLLLDPLEAKCGHFFC